MEEIREFNSLEKEIRGNSEIGGCAWGIIVGGGVNKKMRKRTFDWTNILFVYFCQIFIIEEQRS